jgi:RecF/RecN/SMC N terminal domain
MSVIRTEIRSVEVQGFRAFGRRPQKLSFSSHIAAIWAPNSQGKTSLAEAFEFLLTGRIVRRELMASTQDEFAEALRNAHLPNTEQVYVQAEIVGSDDELHIIRRTLVEDYAKRRDCQSVLKIDGEQATREDLIRLGIVLSQPPLEAPILTQHTLGYLFSAKPQERASYFKTLLEVTDLEDFRTAVAALEVDIQPQDDAKLRKLTAAASVPEVRFLLEPLRASIPARDAIENAFQAAAVVLIESAGDSLPPEADDRIAALEHVLTSVRRAAFPTQGFEAQPLGGWVPPAEAEWAKIDAYLEERAAVVEETRRLTSLFREALALPALVDIQATIDCPLCGTEDSLTPVRVAFIRQRVEGTAQYQTAEAKATHALQQLEGLMRSFITGVDSALPCFLRWSARERRQTGFRIPRLRDVLGEDAPSLVDPWIVGARRLGRLAPALRFRAAAVLEEVSGYLGCPTALVQPASLKQAVSDLATARQHLVVAIQEYLPQERALTIRLHEIIDAESRTTGWPDLIDLARDPAGLRDSLLEQAARRAVQAELIRALRQIDTAKEKVLDDKFHDMSDSIQYWWSLLRPADLVYFSALKQRPGARRTVDFKAGLSIDSDRSMPKVRDVIAVFSQSQIQCLGLALFIARAAHDASGFVVLDDPVLSSDEDYRAHFNASVVERLIDLPMQVIILTQDQKTWRDLEHRYLHRNIDMFQMSLQNALDGPTVSHTSDDLVAMLIRVRSLLGADHPDLRKQSGGYLRDAAECFCKEILVRNRWKAGDQKAALSDYDGKNLRALCPKVEPLLTLDASHAGKLRAVRDILNPAQHDDTIPSRGSLLVALGDLERLKKDYL